MVRSPNPLIRFCVDRAFGETSCVDNPITQSKLYNISMDERGDYGEVAD